jgi:hypothetical protein
MVRTGAAISQLNFAANACKYHRPLHKVRCQLKKGKSVVILFFFFLFMYDIHHCFIFRPYDSDAGIEPRTVAITILPVRRSNHSARSHPQYINQNNKAN